MMLPPLILTVSSNRRNLELLDEVLAKGGFRTYGVDTMTALDAALEGEAGFALALLDLSGFDRSVWERCERLQEKGVPFLILSPSQSAVVEQEGRVWGARGVLTKPLKMQDLLQLVQALIG